MRLWQRKRIAPKGRPCQQRTAGKFIVSRDRRGAKVRGKRGRELKRNKARRKRKKSKSRKTIKWVKLKVNPNPEVCGYG